jgi:hypothetical protein
MLLLTRTYTDHATYGVLFNKKTMMPICLTLELPWKQNKQFISCIPSGIYTLKKYSGTRFKNSFWVNDVPNRYAILIHAGNTVSDTVGCILPGNVFRGNSVLNSRLTMKKLNELLPFETELEIT